MAQGGDKNISVDKPVATASGQVTVTGPPNEVIIVHRDGTSGGDKQIQLDPSGKATVPLPNQPGSITIILASDFSKAVIVTVIDPLQH